jgi:hypothetical protein
MVPDWLEVVIHGPVTKAFAEVPGGSLREAEVDPEPHSCIDDIGTQGPLAVVVADRPGTAVEISVRFRCSRPKSSSSARDAEAATAL